MGPFRETAAVFLRLGLTSFGGPAAHIGILRDEVVLRRRWCTDAHFADLVALCQFLPGPASSQLVFALGRERAGLPGALLASVLFTMPSALALIGLALGVAGLGPGADGGLVHGLKLAAAAVVAHAVRGMASSLCPDRARSALALAVAVVLVVAPSLMAQGLHVGMQAGLLAGVVVLAGVVGLALYGRRPAAPPELPVPPSMSQSRRAHVMGAALLTLWALLLVVLPLAARVPGARLFVLADSFYRAGSLVFGGGHVVLPMLRAEVVPPGWVSEEAFLMGYGATQAVPGPLFSFAAYLGAAMDGGPVGVGLGLWCLLWIFIPAWLLVAGALPFWDALRRLSPVRAALAGANAAVVGILLAALYRPVITESVLTVWDAAAVVLAFIALARRKMPVWVLVAAMAVAGVALAHP